MSAPFPLRSGWSAGLTDTTADAVHVAQAFLSAVRESVRQRVGGNDAPPEALDRHQRSVHGLAWVATVVSALDAAHQWGLRCTANHSLGEREQLVLLVGFGEYLSQLLGGVPMSQSEFVRPLELGVEQAASALKGEASVQRLLRDGTSADARAALIGCVTASGLPHESLHDPTLDMIREQFRSFTTRRITSHAHAWHLADMLLPDEVVDEMGAMGVFGICIAPDFGGLGLGKLAMCVVSEELSRGWIAAGSLGTRSEIAGELISLAGTPEQKQYWLPRLASGEALPDSRVHRAGRGLGPRLTPNPCPLYPRRMAYLGQQELDYARRPQ